MKKGEKCTYAVHTAATLKKEQEKLENTVDF